MLDHERICFVNHTRLGSDQIDTHNLVNGPPQASVWRGYDGLLVGGAGEYYVSKRNLPQFDDTLDFFGEVVAASHPMFASCFGYQCLVLTLGGDIIHDPDNTEVGTYPLSLTEAAHDEPLFATLPDHFWAQEGHKDRAIRHPDGLENYAASERCPLQALRVPQKPIWATQFHPELSHESNLHRFRFYQAVYAQSMSLQERQASLERFRESPETTELLPLFLKLVFG